jgi:hypothetical protein
MGGGGIWPGPEAQRMSNIFYKKLKLYKHTFEKCIDPRQLPILLMGKVALLPVFPSSCSYYLSNINTVLFQQFNISNLCTCFIFQFLL